MAILCRWVMAVTMLLAVGPLLAAEHPAETGAFNTAYQFLHDGFWKQAEAAFGEFAQRYTNSARLPEAYLYQAQARYQMTNYSGAIELLLARQPQAGKEADQYLFWLGQTHLKQEDYPAACDAFARLAGEYPLSTRCLEARLGEATAWARRGEWRRAIELLQNTNSVFQSVARTNAASEQVIGGFLLMAEAQSALQDYAAANATLQPLTRIQSLNPALAWRLHFLLCRIRVAQGRPEEALQNTTNLLLAAVGSTDRSLQAESFAFQADLLERLGQTDAAIAAYTNNLADGFPPNRQSQALMKLVELSLVSNRLAGAAQRIEEFSLRYTNGPVTDIALLLLGELRLRQYVTGTETNVAVITGTNAPSVTNNLQRAVAALAALTNNFPQSRFAGKAQLDLGWCLWLNKDWAGCQAACQAALGRLPVSPDQATARFKLADAQFEQKNYTNAITNYIAIVDQYGHLPEVKTNLFEPALYQAVRAGLEAGDLAAASNALAKILAWYPDGFHTERAVLLAGQAIRLRGNPAAARSLLASFAQRAPEAKLMPQVCLAIARTYERENKLPEAIQEYTRWLERFTNCDVRPQAEFSLALAHFHAGNETNALSLLTNFAGHYPTNTLAPLAQWWLGDFYYRNRQWLEAERNYKSIWLNTNLPPSEELTALIYQARMMAGRSAAACHLWANAIDHFTNLTSNARLVKRSPDLWAQAMFAYGDTLLSQDSTNRADDYKTAVDIFGQISEHPNNHLAVLALGQKALALKQWADFTHQYHELTNALLAYQQVITSSNADVSARSMAQIGQAVILEKQAELRPPAERKELLEPALNLYLNVLYGRNVAPGEQADAFMVKRAGLDAVRLLGSGELQNWQQAISVYERMKQLLPPLAAQMDKEIVKAREKAAGH